MHNQKGFALLELLISLLVFAVGICGLLEFEARSFRQENNALLKTYAISQIKEALIFTETRGSKPLTSNFQRQWNEENQRLLPQGEGTISFHADYTEIKLMWSPLKANRLTPSREKLQLKVLKL